MSKTIEEMEEMTVADLLAYMGALARRGLSDGVRFQRAAFVLAGKVGAA